MTNEFCGERLRQLRIIRDMSLSDVAGLVSNSKQYIHQIEGGAQPTEMMVEALATALNVQPRYFYRPYENRVYEGECYFRKAKSTPVNLREKAVHCAALLEDYIGFVEEEFDLPLNGFNYQPDDYRSCGNSDIELLAERLRNEWGLGLDRPIDSMIRVLENQGAVVTHFASLSDKIDAFSINRERPIVIRNPFKDNACRQRFDLAHECGHLALHKFSDMESDDPLKEEQAHRFAGAFLLPRSAFFKEFQSVFSKHINWSALLELKKRWKVSFALMIHRAYDLGMIDALKYRSAYIHLRKTGQTKKEWGDDELTLEELYLLPEITKTLLADYKNTFDNFINENGMSYNLLGEIVDFKFSSVLDQNILGKCF